MAAEVRFIRCHISVQCTYPACTRRSDVHVSTQVKSAQASIKALLSSADEISSEADKNYVLQQLKSATSVIDGLGPGGDL